MTLKKSTILMVAMNSEYILAIPDEECRQFARKLMADNQNFSDLEALLEPFIMEHHEFSECDKEEGIVARCTGDTLWKGFDLTFGTPDYGYETISCVDENNPRELLDLEDFPVLLYVKGDASLLGNPNRITIVGTPEPSDYGKQVAARLGSFFTKRDFVVVSSIGEGIDFEVLQSCVNDKQKTIAVLPSQCYRSLTEEEEKLLNVVVSGGGCLVAEYKDPFKTISKSPNSHERILAALGKALIVVESQLEESPMHTAQYAIKLGRKLGCMNYLPNKNGTEGARMELNDSLIREGTASKLLDGDDLKKFLEELR